MRASPSWGNRKVSRTSRRLVFTKYWFTVTNSRLAWTTPRLGFTTRRFVKTSPGLVKSNPGLVKTTPGLVKSKPGLVKAFGQGSDHSTDTAPYKLCKSTTLFLQGTSSVRTFAASKDNSTFIRKNTLSYPHLP